VEENRPEPNRGTSSSQSNSPSEPISPAKRKRLVSWQFLVTLVVVILVFGTIAIPNFVKARTTACKNSCFGHLKQLDGAIHQWAVEYKKEPTDEVTLTNVVSYLKNGTLPSCPAGGTYSVSTVSSSPLCTIAGHTLQ
jgi:hypothetical protein